THVARFDVTPDGRKLAAVGNFAKVNGQTRVQLAMIDTNVSTSGVATVSSWATNRFDRAHNSCAAGFDTFTRDIDFSPDGSFFAVTTTGAFAGGAGSGTMCDSSSRWETNSTGNDPTWVDYTGGDTSHGVAVTGDVVYTGGHFRWQNNPFKGDQAGPGAVPRSGIAALDAANGLPLSWNPGRTRGVGAQALYATPDGLWVGSDTTRFKNLTRGRIAFVPLSDGTTLPAVAPAALPNNLFIAQSGGLRSRSVNASGAPTGGATVVNTAFDWGTVRGAFYLNGTLYYGSGSGLSARSFDPATGTVDTQRTVNLYGLSLNVANLTGMFYDPALHRLYYTVAGNSALFYRYFTPESEVVGAQEFRANANGVDFRTVAGMTLAGGRILYGSSSDRALRSVAFGAGGVTGTPVMVSNDGSWGSARAIFVPNG
ncbi:MAG TPA: PKD domain containing protein, partial [Marmoricola sp.]|nr:PKD domain containing protein [Marmoricola sp.]